MYRPDGNFEDLIGCSINGEWKIEIISGYDGYFGHLFDWEIIFNDNLRAEGIDSTVVINNGNPSGSVQPVDENTAANFNFTAPSVSTTTTITDTLRLYSHSSNGDCYYDTVVRVVVLAPGIGDTTATICANQLPYTWHGKSYDAGGIYPDTLSIPASNGCDSIVTLHLTVNSPTVSINPIAPVTVCAGGNISLNASATGTPSDGISYSWAGPNSFTSTQQNPTVSNATAANAGTYTVTATASYGAGCSATTSTTVDVTVNSPSVALNPIAPVTVCAGGNISLNASATGTPSDGISYSWAGPNSFTSTQQNPTVSNASAANAGSYTVTATASYGDGCSTSTSSTVVVTVNPTYNITDSKTICASLLPYTWNGVTFNAAGTQSTTLHTVNGCDSVVTMTLTVNSTYNVTDSKTICASLLPYTWNGVTFNAAGTQSTTLHTVNGCDSVVTMTLTVNPT